MLLRRGRDDITDEELAPTREFSRLKVRPPPVLDIRTVVSTRAGLLFGGIVDLNV